ncbi:uncharacterized protein LOC135133129 isoform X3 [Zophobas morio]|uniref:uncharacterized protein LOC135133129 isoform X3 n=1 Tax=Zophobas morio TaxID=2755281 RepID=UPI0030828835
MNSTLIKEKIKTDDSSVRTCGNSILDDSIDVINEIETFIKEYEILPNMCPLVVNKGKIYDSDTDLLKILDSDNDSRKSQHSMPPKKRKFEEPKKPAKKREECKRGRSAARKLNKAQQLDYVEPKFFTCKRLMHQRKRVIDRVIFHCDKRKPKVVVVKSRCDARAAWNVVVKKEVIDLTSEEDVFFTVLKFAKECYFETAEEFEVKTAKASVVIELLHEVTVFVPEILFHVEETCIDLTVEEEVVASEKELANRILPIVFDCYKIYEINKMANVIHSIEECLTPEETTVDNFLAYNLISKHAASLGRALLTNISHIFVKNLNLPRFLEIVASKLDVHYMVSVKAKYVALYLYSMLHPQREACTSRVARELLRNIDSYVELLQMKQETVGSTEGEDCDSIALSKVGFIVVFTEEQLEQLRYQIEQYNALAVRQEQLMAAYNGFPGMDREVKMEILNAQQPPTVANIKVDLDVICIDD